MHYDGHDWVINIFFPDTEQVWPGDTVRAFFCMLSPEEHIGQIQQGMDFQLREGSRVIAEGKVTQIIDLDESAKRPANG